MGVDNQETSSAKNWFTWALLALLPGLTGWCIVLTQKQIQQNRTDNYHQISQQQKDEFLQKYEEWNRLSEREKMENPWGSGPYGGPEMQRKLMLHQEERLLADLPELAAETDLPEELGEMLYGPGWKLRVQKYQKQIEYQEILGIFSSILLLTGGLVLLIGILLRLAALRRTKKGEADAKTKSPKTAGPTAADKNSSEQPSKVSEEKKEKEEEEEVHLFTRKTPRQKPSARPCANVPSESNGQPQPTIPSTAASIKSSSPAVSPAASSSSLSAGAAAALLTESEPAVSDPILSSLMTPIPVVQGLSDLSEQMSAIREFAAEQQNQVKKLQDGYDWMLIKRFCLRIIRCVDNIEDRMRQLQKDNQDISALKDIRDEILFALESSGLEQFEPEVGLEYRGLERYAEAIKEKESTSEPEKSGRIAEVVRPGYQYLINDEEVKIVRCAQVKLYA